MAPWNRNPEERKRAKTVKKLERLRRKAQKKVQKYQKKMAKIRKKVDEKAQRYAKIEKQLINAQKPQVGDPILPESGIVSGYPFAGPSPTPSEKERVRKEKRAAEEKERAERRRIARGDLTLYERFETIPFEQLESRLMNATSREERIFYRTVLNLKLQIEQEKVIGEVLL